MITFKQFILEDYETRDQYMKRLTKTLKIKQLGHGAYATVFQHPVYHNVAVKYVNPDDDPMYLEFIELCQKHPHNPWLPKVVGINNLTMQSWHKKAPNERGTLIFFQKLRKATSSDIKTAIQSILASVPDSVLQDKMRQDTRNLNGFHLLFPEEWKVIAQHSTDKNIREVAKILAQVRASDIHNKNVMMRDEGGKSQLVFTDPVAS